MSNYEDLIAEANAWLSESPDAPYHEAVSSNVVGLVARLTDALEAETVPTENEREALIETILDVDTLILDSGNAREQALAIADAILASLPVPTKNEDADAILADVLSRLLAPDASYAERINDTLELLNDVRRVTGERG